MKAQREPAPADLLGLDQARRRIDELEAQARDLRKENADLRASEAYTRSLVLNQGAGIGVVDADEYFVFANPAAESIFGVAKGTLPGRNLEEFLSPESYRFMREQTLSRRQGERGQYELQIERPDGSRRWLQINASPQWNAHGTFSSTYGVFTDISERKRLEESLRHRLDMERLVGSISTEFIDLRAEEVDEGIDRALERIGQFARVDRSYLFQVDPDRQTVSNTHEWCAPGIGSLREQLQEVSVSTIPWWMRRLSGFESIHLPRVVDLPVEAATERAFFEAHEIRSLVAVPLRFGNSLWGFLGLELAREERTWGEEDIDLLKLVAEIVVNALSRRLLDVALRESEERFRHLTEATTAAIFIHRDGRLLYVNPTAARLTGYSAAELLQRDFLSLVDHDHRVAVGEYRRAARQGEAVPTRFEVRIVAREGERRWVDLHSAEVQLDGERATIETLVDLTERKQYEQERESLLAELREALAKVTTLSGLIPICAWCGKLRNEQGYWQRVEEYVKEHADVRFSHGLCEDCSDQLD